MDRADIVPVLDKNGSFIYNSNRQIVATTYWRFVYGGYEYIIDSTCNATVQKAAEGGAGCMDEVVREDIDGNQKLYVTPLGKAVMPLVTEIDSGLMRAEDYKKLLWLIDKFYPKTDKFLWTNEQNYNDNNNWE